MDDELLVPEWALTLTQPWATLVAIHAKAIETRSWPHSFRGPLAIHAAKSFPDDDKLRIYETPFADVLKDAGIISVAQLPTASFVCVATLTNCYRFDDDTMRKVTEGALKGRWPRYEHHFGNYDAGRFGFKLENAIALPNPVPARGFQRLWRIPKDVRAHLAEELRAA